MSSWDVFEVELRLRRGGRSFMVDLLWNRCRLTHNWNHFALAIMGREWPSWKAVQVRSFRFHEAQIH
jgi:chloramphenicol O-acetyltransferase